MSEARPPGDEPAPRADTVFFLSDYGQDDEFTGVVHAVLRRLAPGVAVVDLTHRIPAFDVRAGAAALRRAVPHLGSGVVLAVVDPGVGSPRRGLAVEADDQPGRQLFFVGPDNGLLLPAVEASGGVRRAVALDPGVASTDRPSTFDGRDVFAPAAAALCAGRALESLGSPVAPEDLARIPAPTWSELPGDSRGGLRSEVTWVDHFGNVQLAVPGALAAAFAGRRLVLEVERAGPAEASAEAPRLPTGAGSRPEELVLVASFSELEPGRLGLLIDANDQLAVVVREGSAAQRLGVSAGAIVRLLR